VHSQQLERDVPLIVVHRHDAIELASRGTDHERIAGQRAAEIESLAPAALDCRGEPIDLLVAKQALLAAVRIERGDANARRVADGRCSEQRPHHRVSQPGAGNDAFFA
jgi:hypothetical protein